MSIIHFTRLAVACALLSATGLASAADLLIRNAEVHTLTREGKLAKADVLVRDGKVAAVGTALQAPAGATVVEANGKPLTPGLFAGLTAIGIEEVSGEASTVDEYLKLNAPRTRCSGGPSSTSRSRTTPARCSCRSRKRKDSRGPSSSPAAAKAAA